MIALSSSLLLGNSAYIRADEVSDIIKQIEPISKTKPEEAIAQLRQFQTSNPTLGASRLAAIDFRIGKIYQESLKDTDKALAAINAALARPIDSRTYFGIITYKFQSLLGAKRHEEIIALVKSELPKYLAEPEIHQIYYLKLFYSYDAAARSTGKTDDYIATSRSVLQQYPHLAAIPAVVQPLIEHLLTKPGQEAEALSWAKLHWMVCDFDGKSVNAATSLLQKAWTSKDMNMAKGTEFLKALQDSAAPNPLKEVPLPSFDKAKLKATQNLLSERAVEARVINHLLLDENGKAMLAARRMLLDDPAKKGNEAAAGMARVFKAVDFNVLRANALVQYLQTGQGVNPLDEFFKEYPPSGGA